MSRTPEQALAVLRAAAADGRLDALCERHGLDLVGAFGSAVRPGVRPAGDLDVVVRFGQGATADLVAVTSDLVDLVGLDAVDVMDLGRAGVVARGRALGPGAEALFERCPGDYARAQMAALTIEMETAPMRRRDLELLAGR